MIGALIDFFLQYWNTLGAIYFDRTKAAFKN